MVTGKKGYVLSGAEKKINSLLKSKIKNIFNDFSPNPNITEVEKGIKLYKKFNPDMMITVGGGSVIDMGKTINLLANNTGRPIDYIKGLKKPKNKGNTHIPIPTTSGTGSEATYFATIYIDKKKYSIGDKKITLPQVSIVDPALTESMPKSLTATTGLDALCQGIESYWAVNSTKTSIKYAKEAILLALNNIEKAVNKPDKNSRLNMAKAAHLSGKAINISKTTASHSISYPITSYYNVPHGHAVALTIGQLIEFNYNISNKNCIDKRGVDFVKNRLREIINLLGCNNAYEAKIFIQKLMEKIGLNHQLSRLNIDEDGQRLIVDKGFTPDRMNNNPRIVLKKDIENILYEIR